MTSLHVTIAPWLSMAYMYVHVYVLIADIKCCKLHKLSSHYLFTDVRFNMQVYRNTLVTACYDMV